MKPSGCGGAYAHVHIATSSIWFKPIEAPDVPEIGLPRALIQLFFAGHYNHLT
jgi:hypothetical protein